MKKYRILLLSLCLALALQVTVLAGEESGENGPVVDAMQDPPVFFSMDGSDPCWDGEFDCYGDVLEGNEITVYQELERRFAAHVAGTEEIPLENTRFSASNSDGYVYMDAWVIEPVLSKANASDTWVQENTTAARNALIAFLFDHPEYFWIRQHYAVGYGYIGNTAYIKVFYIAQEGFDSQAEQQAELDDTVAALTKAVEGLSDAQKVAWWDNWLAVNNRYKSAALADNYVNTDATPWSAIGALLKDYQPVCEGYAKALQLLCHEADIPCVQLSGLANGGDHMWTAIKLDGTWYFCDPTWDDPGSDNTSASFSTREYLLTAEPYSHTLQYYTFLGYPDMSTSDYGQPMAQDFGWSADTDSTPLGYELGDGVMIIALYDEDGRFLTMGACSSMVWDRYSSIYLAPEFSQAVLEQTGSIVRFNLGDTVDWAPVSNAQPIE